MVAIPRNSASVPMVTASEGSPNRVTSRPLDMPRIEATDRSISPLMMISVIGRVMIAISPLDRPRLNRLLLVRNCGETDAPTIPIITTTRARPVSQRRAVLKSSDTRSRSLMAGSSQPQRDGEPDRDEPVHADGQDEQETPDRLVPERRDAQDVERGADGVEQQRAERRAHRAAAPAEDRDSADHHGGYHLKLVAGARGRVDGAVLFGPQHAGHSGDRPAYRERHED